MFLALADPAARQILEVLRRHPSSMMELVQQVGDIPSNTQRWLQNLEATKLITIDSGTAIYRLDRFGVDRLVLWAARFAP